MLLTLLSNLGMFGGNTPTVNIPAPIGHPAVYYVKGKRKKSRDLESAQDAIKRIWERVVAEVTALPEVVETVQPARKVILPLIPAAPVKPFSTTLFSQLSKIKAEIKRIEALRQDEDDEEILMMGAI